MDITAIPLFSMLRSRLGYLGERQRLIAENVANADTPGFVGRDLKPFSFGDRLAAQGNLTMVQPAQTNPGHLAGAAPRAAAGGAFRSTRSPDSETTLDGNAVVLEDQMIKMSEARMQYDAAIGFYQKSLQLLRMAARAPGR